MKGVGSQLVLGGWQAWTVLPWLMGVGNALAQAEPPLDQVLPGTVVAWGDNGYGQTEVPAGATNVVAIAAGLYHSLALRADGRVIGWGWNFYGQTDVPAELSSVVAIAGGGAHSLALRANGTVVAWGSNDEGQRDVPAGLSNVVAIVGGSHHSLALKQDGTVVAWGGSSSTNLGLAASLSNVVALAASAGGGPPLGWVYADGTLSGVPTDRWWGWGGDDPFESLTNVVTMAVGYTHGLALRADGSVVGPTGSVVPGLTNAVAVAAGLQSSVILRADGTVAIWGLNGQWGTRHGLSNVVAVASGWQHGLALVGQGPPVVPVALARRTVSSAANAVFHAPATGAWPLSYQWQWNGVDLPGATGSSLVLTNVQPHQAGLYSVRVRNTWGEATSMGAELTVLPLAIRVPPAPQISYPGGSATFTVRAVGNEPLAYQWQFNGVALPGATNALLRLDPLDFSQVGEYSVAVSNPLGRVVSEAARLDLSVVVAWDCGRARGVATGLTNIVAVAAGEDTGVLLRADGSVATWGRDRYGLYPPQTLSNVVAVASEDEDDFGLALTSEGKVFGWGDEYDMDDYPVPPNLRDVVAIDAGQIGLALRANGTVAAWGEYYASPLGGFGRSPLWLSNVVQISAGESDYMGVAHHLALLADGTIATFGSDGTRQTAVVAGLTNNVAVAAGYDHGLALRGDGTVTTWATTPDTIPPKVPTGLTNVVAIVAERAHDLALLGDGTVVGWGAEGCDASAPYMVPPGLSNVVALSAGSQDLALLGHGPPTLPRSLAQRVVGMGANAVFYALATGELPLHYQWQFQGADLPGANQPFLVLTNVGLAQRGHYSLNVSNQWGVTTGAHADLTLCPVLISGQPIGQTTWLGQTVTLTVEAQGRAPLTYQWRHNGVDLPGATNRWLELSRLQFHQSGEYSVVVTNAFGSVNSEGAWLEVSTVVPWGYSEFGVLDVPRGLTDVMVVAAGRYHCLALRNGGTVIQWGLLIQDQVPVGLTDVVAIAAGDSCSLAARSDGTVAAWGSYYEGGTYVPVRLPPGLTNVVAISAGGSYVLALRSDGTVAEWDYSGKIRTGVPGGLGRVMAVAAGGNHSVALLQDGTVVAWGSNAAGQTNVPPDLANVVAIAAGGDDNLAVRADGTVVTWGRNYEGWMNVPQGLTDVTAIAVAGVHCLALREGGSLVAWGRYYDGFHMTPMTVPTGLSNVVAIAAAEGYSLAVVWPRPVLEILRLDDNALLVEWDAPTANWVLEESEGLESENWRGVSPAPVNDGARWSVLLEAPDRAKFYRLRSR